MKPQLQPSGRTRGVLRLLGYLTVLGLLSGAWLFHRAHAELGERALQVGRELRQMRGNELGITRLTVNGAPLALSSVSTQRPVAEVLERFAQACQDGQPDIQAELRSAVARGAKLPSLSLFGVLRSVPDEKEGTAACFASPQRNGAQGLLTRLERALHQEDLSELGQVRYVYAKRTGDGQRTHVITAWSEGALKLTAMFPEQGDAPGEDLVAGARPQHARRVLSAYGEDHLLHMVIYQADAGRAPAALLDSYQQTLASRGYRSMVESAIGDVSPIPARVFRQGERDQLLALTHERDGTAQVVAFRIPSNGNVQLMH